MSPKGLIEIKDYSFYYPKSEDAALKGISLDIYDGEILLICGGSGSGKTTLLKALKKEAAPAGDSAGRIKFNIDSKDISIVFQNPSSQLVTSSIMHDLAFPMENLGLAQHEMKKRMAETVSFFSLDKILHKRPDEISGGQAKMAALCSALMTQPKLLLLDEPFSQLDPIAAREFLGVFQSLKEELGLSIILSEHRLDDAIGIADRVVMLDSGRVLYDGAPDEITESIWGAQDEKTAAFIPEIPKLSLSLGFGAVFTPGQFKKSCSLDIKVQKPQKNTERENKIRLLSVRDVFFCYDDGEHVLKNLSLDIFKGEIFCILGANGSGKSTMLKLIAGIINPKSGVLKHGGKSLTAVYIPQDLNAYFCKDTIKEEILFEIGEDGFCSPLAQEIFDDLQILPLLGRHPYDLSGGEQQKAVLAMALLKNADLIILDEPTKGMDINLKAVMARLLKKNGASVIMATHDIEFAAKYSHRCAMLFDGSISYCLPSREFFEESRYYTTAINRAVRHILPDAIFFKDVLEICQKEKPWFVRDF